MKKTNTKRGGDKKALLFILAFFLFSVACEVFGLLYLMEVKNPFLVQHIKIFSILYGVFIALIFLVSIIFLLKEKEAITKFFFSFYLVFLFLMILLYVLERTGFFIVFKDAESFQKYLGGLGGWMPVLYTLVQFLQVIILPIPSMVSTVAGVALFGSFWAMIYSLVGILLGSYFAFFLGRKLGYKAVSWMVGKETLDKWQKKLKGKDNFFLTLMFFLPLFPDDILCVLAGLSTMSTRYFIVVITLSRFLGIAGTCYSIDFIPFNTWWGIIIWIVFFAAMLVVFVFTYKNMENIQRKLRGWRRKKKDKE